MLSENIKNLRKSKGYSQETLAAHLHVVRQTVSKWEKGLSVPDAVMLEQMAELFEVPVSSLLEDSNKEPSNIQEQENQNPDNHEIARQLAILNETLAMQAIRRKKIIKRIFIAIALALFILIALYIFCFALFSFHVEKGMNVSSTTAYVKIY
jgi:putative transcriptional regulator